VCCDFVPKRLVPEGLGAKPAQRCIKPPFAEPTLTGTRTIASLFGQSWLPRVASRRWAGSVREVREIPTPTGLVQLFFPYLSTRKIKRFTCKSPSLLLIAVGSRVLRTRLGGLGMWANQDPTRWEKPAPLSKPSVIVHDWEPSSPVAYWWLGLAAAFFGASA
jgi:hypothetical protein